MVRWGGKDRYLGQDWEKANAKYLTDPVNGLSAWSAWRAARNTQRLPPMRPMLTMADILERFLEFKRLEGGADVENFYAKHLKRFAHAYGQARGDLIRAKHLQALKEDMLRHGYAPRTVNHDLQAVKTLLRWGAGMEYAPLMDLRIVRGVPLPEPPDRSLPVAKVRRMVATAPETLAPWLAINYLCLMRPSEVVRVVQQEGEWESDGIYKIRSKVGRRTRQPRRVVFSRLALKWLGQCEPRWTRLDSYSQAVRDFFGPGGPHPLRHSGATHLIRAGVDRATVDLLLGHLPPRVSLTYAQIRWSSLRRTAARLSV